MIEKTLGVVIQGTLIGVVLWAVSGSLFGLFFRDDLFFFGHHGIRRSSYADMDYPY
jgi:hypothetical protein